jgi:hypothetical protein
MSNELAEATECVSRCLLEIDCLNAEGETLHAELDAERALADDLYAVLDTIVVRPGWYVRADAVMARYRKARQQ